MGADCSKSTSAEDWRIYDIVSPSLAEHYVLGKLVGCDRLGDFRVAEFQRAAAKVLRECPVSSSLPLEVVNRINALKHGGVVVRTTELSDMSSKLDDLEDQRDVLEMQLRKMQAMPASRVSDDELQWLHASLGSLNVQIAKERKQTRGLRDVLLREKQLLEKCKHRFVAAYIESFEDHRSFYSVFERYHGSIVDWWPNGVLSIDVVARQSYQLVSALHHLHSSHILHRDVCPENLLLQRSSLDSDVLLSNLSVAVQLRPLDYLSRRGTPHFASNEGLVSNSKAFPADVLDCGCTIFWMLLGRCPFSDGGASKSSSSGAKSWRSFGRAASLCTHFCSSAGRLLGREGGRVLPEERVLSIPDCGCLEEPSFAYADGTECPHVASIELLRQMLTSSAVQRLTIGQVLRHAWIAMAGPEAERPTLRGSLSSSSKSSRSKSVLDFVVPARAATQTKDTATRDAWDTSPSTDVDTESIY